jgi:hypothetical protein
MEAQQILELLAEEHKRHILTDKKIISGSDIDVIYTDDPKVQLYRGLRGSNLPVERTRRDCEQFPTMYSITVNGILFFQYSEEPFEERGKENEQRL